jgi:hypothetical protein
MNTLARCHLDMLVRLGANERPLTKVDKAMNDYFPGV